MLHYDKYILNTGNENVKDATNGISQELLAIHK